MRRLLFWLIFLGLFGWAGYTAALIGWAHFAVQDVVEGVLQDSAPRQRAAFAAGTPQALDRLAVEIRAATLAAARKAGLGLDESNISVALVSSGIQVTVRWTYPAITWNGEDILAIPLSVQRSVAPNP
jgi:hypothetical protein